MWRRTIARRTMLFQILASAEGSLDGQHRRKSGDTIVGHGAEVSQQVIPTFGVLPTDKLAQLFELYRKYDGDEDGALSFTEFYGMWLGDAAAGRRGSMSPLKEGGGEGEGEADGEGDGEGEGEGGGGGARRTRRRAPQFVVAARRTSVAGGARGSVVGRRTSQACAARLGRAAGGGEADTVGGDAIDAAMAVLDDGPFTRALRTAPHLYEEQLQALRSRRPRQDGHRSRAPAR